MNSNKLDMDWDQEQFEQTITSYSAEKLADMVIANRYLGLFEENAILAMEELARRRALGDTFAYEEYIANNLKTLPALDFSGKGKGGVMDTLKTLDIVELLKGTIDATKSR